MKYLLVAIAFCISMSVVAQEEQSSTSSEEENITRNQETERTTDPVSQDPNEAQQTNKNEQSQEVDGEMNYDDAQEADFASEAADLQTRARRNVAQAERLFKEEKYKQAIEIYRSIYDELSVNRIDLEAHYGQVAFNPDSILLRIAESYYMDAQYDNAKGELLGYLAIKRSPMEPREYFLQASIDYKMQDFADAIDSYSQILSLPKLTDSIKFYSHFYRGISSYQLEYYQDAYDDFLVCSRLRSESYEPYYNMGRCLFREVPKVQDMKRTIKMLTRSLALNVDHVPSLFLRARAYERIKKYKEAMVDFEKCIELRPGYADAHYKKAIMMYHFNKDKVDKKVCEQIYEAVKLGSVEALLFQREFCN